MDGFKPLSFAQEFFPKTFDSPGGKGTTSLFCWSRRRNRRRLAEAHEVGVEPTDGRNGVEERKGKADQAIAKEVTQHQPGLLVHDSHRLRVI